MAPTCQKNRVGGPARIMAGSFAMGPITGLKIKVSGGATCRTCADPAVILIDQLKSVYIDGELETIDTRTGFPKVMRRDYNRSGLNRRWKRARPPDQVLKPALYGCGGLS